MRSGIAVPDFLFRHGGRQSEEVVQLRGEIAVGRDALEPRELIVFSELLEEEEQFAAVIAGDQIVNAEISFQLVGFPFIIMVETTPFCFSASIIPNIVTKA